ncbi:hypothetical protein GCM10009716_19240 [Streptomyces sodiiphilus]|uniref:Tetratricopeptide repeat protein n=1 Tax=Streptomyces sodiiphilus TaxID=226217 RepID=A0ABN2P4C7_9ACTN
MGEGAVFDAEQRMVPADPGRYRELVAGLDREVAEARKAGTVTVGLLRRAGVGHLVLRELAEAEELLTEALRLCEGEDAPRRQVAVLINLGDAHRYGGDLAAAWPCYRRALWLARERCPEVTDFALQHMGKHRTDAGDFAAAERLLTEALWLRREKEDPELLASTEQALAYCRRRAREAGAADAGAVREGGEGVRRG